MGHMDSDVVLDAAEVFAPSPELPPARELPVRVVRPPAGDVRAQHLWSWVYAVGQYGAPLPWEAAEPILRLLLDAHRENIVRVARERGLRRG
jgi:hypothetical protein